MCETVLRKTTRYAEDEGEAAGSYKYCKAARAAPNRTGRAKPKEAAHRDVDYRERDVCRGLRQTPPLITKLSLYKLFG